MLPYVTKGMQENYVVLKSHDIRLDNVEEKIKSILEKIGMEG